ncbi:MAG TPA: type IV pilus assembly protein PilM [Pyrinomonadaceae bacterium]|nr:type IV pilus assembly protein PilM [Pyrinomonadaceae bacterium]
MFESLFHRRRSVGLDVGASSVKVVELSGKSKDLTLKALAAEPLAPETIYDGQIIDCEETSSAIKKLLREHDVRARDVAAGVGNHWLIIKIIEVPLMAESELSECIEWHAEEHVPYELSQVRLDYQIVGSTDSSLQVLVVACKHEPVDNLQQVIGAAGRRPVVIDVDALALHNCYAFNYQPEDDAPVALVHVGASRMIINIARGSRCDFTRDITIGSNLYTEQLQREMGLTFEQAEAAKLKGTTSAEIKGANVMEAVAGLSKMLTTEEQFESLLTKFLETFEIEIRRTLDFYQYTAGEGSVVRKIMLSGGGSNLKGLREFLAEKFQIQVEPLDPFRRIKRDERSFNHEYLNRVGPEMAVAVGLALRGTDAPLLAINLAESGLENRSAEVPEAQVGKRLYKFKGYNVLGDDVTGERRAGSRAGLRAILRREQIVLTSATRQERLSFIPASLRRRKKAPTRISEDELASFTRQLHVLLWAGAPVITALDIAAQGQKNRRFRQTLAEVRRAVEEGSLLGQAMREHPEVFDEFYVSLIESSETGYIFDSVMPRLTADLERRAELRRKVRASLLYPLLGLGFGLVVSVPIIFRNLTGARVLAYAGSAGVMIASLSLLIALLLLVAYFRTERGRLQIDGLLLRLPFLGTSLGTYALARFARLLSTMLASGVPIMSALSITEKEMGNAVFAEAVKRIGEGVYRGESFSDSMTDAFPEILTQMVGVGEQGGALDSTLGKIAELYEHEVDRAVSRLTLISLLMSALLFALTVGVLAYGVR